MGSLVELDPLHRSMVWQVIRIMFPICMKALLDGTLDREAARDRNRDAMLEGVLRGLEARQAARTAPEA